MRAIAPPFRSFFAPERRRARLWLLAAATVVTGAATGYFALQMEDHGVGIIEFELTRTAAKAQQHYDDLGSAGRNDAMWSLILDYPYLISYGLLLAGAAIAVGDRTARRGRPALAALAPWFAWGALGGAAADALENAMLLLILAENTGQPWPGLAFAFAVTKFALITLALLYIACGLVLTLGRRAMARAAA